MHYNTSLTTVSQVRLKSKLFICMLTSFFYFPTVSSPNLVMKVWPSLLMKSLILYVKLAEGKTQSCWYGCSVICLLHDLSLIYSMPFLLVFPHSKVFHILEIKSLYQFSDWINIINNERVLDTVCTKNH